MPSEKRVLVVDDDEDTCSGFADILEDLGYVVDVAHRSQEALALVSERPARIVLVDYRLPGMTGVELFKRMRQIRSNVEGLLVTGWASPDVTSEAVSSGLQCVIEKPVDFPVLLSRIEGAFR